MLPRFSSVTLTKTRYCQHKTECMRGIYIAYLLLLLLSVQELDPRPPIVIEITLQHLPSETNKELYTCVGEPLCLVYLRLCYYSGRQTRSRRCRGEVDRQNMVLNPWPQHNSGERLGFFWIIYLFSMRKNVHFF